MDKQWPDFLSLSSLLHSPFSISCSRPCFFEWVMAFAIAILGSAKHVRSHVFVSCFSQTWNGYSLRIFSAEWYGEGPLSRECTNSLLVHPSEKSRVRCFHTTVVSGCFWAKSVCFIIEVTSPAFEKSSFRATRRFPPLGGGSILEEFRRLNGSMMDTVHRFV